MGSWVDPGYAVGAAVGYPDEAAADGDAGRAAAGRDRRCSTGAAEVDAPHRPGGCAADPDRAGADGEPQGGDVGLDAAFEDAAPLRVDRGDAGPLVVLSLIH